MQSDSTSQQRRPQDNPQSQGTQTTPVSSVPNRETKKEDKDISYQAGKEAEVLPVKAVEAGAVLDTGEAKEMKEAQSEQQSGQTDEAYSPDLINKETPQKTSGPPPQKSDDEEEVQLPLTDQKILEGVHSDIMDSLHWLAVLCLRKLQKAHYILKSAGGKVLRIKLKKESA